MSGLFPALFGLLLLFVAGPEAGPWAMALYLLIDAIGSICFGVGVAKLRKSTGSTGKAIAVLGGLVLFIVNVVFLVIAGGTMYGM